MASFKQFVCTLLMITFLVVVITPKVHAAASCGTVAQSLAPCIDYIRTGGSGLVPGGCCDGIRSLLAQTQNTPDRQTVCGCLKSAANVMPTYVRLAASLPSKCSVKLPYNIDPSIDCSRVR